jgi:hypothetical protein
VGSAPHPSSTGAATAILRAALRAVVRGDQIPAAETARRDEIRIHALQDQKLHHGFRTLSMSCVTANMMLRLERARYAFSAKLRKSRLLRPMALGCSALLTASRRARLAPRG